MIEVNLHPSGDRKRRKKGGGLSGIDLEMPDLGDIQIVESMRSDPWNAAFIISLIIVPLLVGGLWFTQRSEEQQLEDRLDAALADSARLADLRALSDSLTDRKQEIQERIRLVRGLDQNRYAWARLLDELSSALPANAYLRAVKRQSQLPDMQIQILGTAGRPLVITDYVRNLENSSHIASVEIVGSNKQTVGGVTTQGFTLNLTYRPEDAGSAGSVALSPSSSGGE